MDNRFKLLAEIFSEIRYFDLKEVESLIEIHYKSWYNDEFKSEFDNDIIKKRKELVNEISSIQIERNFIESQLLIAKSELKEGKKVDTKWMAKANLAFRIKARQIVNLQEKLANLKTIEKELRTDRANSEDRLLNKEYFEYLKNNFGEEKAKNIRTELCLNLGFERRIDNERKA